MAHGRTNLGKILVPTLIVLLLCGIFAGEFPELLSLTDNATNDFTVSRTNSVVLPVSAHASRQLPTADIDSRAPAPDLVFSRPSPFENAALVPSDRFILYSVLRT